MNENLEFSASYTLSKAYDDASSYDEQPQNPFDLAAENALSRQHQQQRFVFNALWDLPIGEEGDSHNANRSRSWFVSAFKDIEIAPIFTVETGRPADPLTGLVSNRTGAFPLSSRPLGFGRNFLETPNIVTLDLRSQILSVWRIKALGPGSGIVQSAQPRKCSSNQSGVRLRPDSDRRIYTTHRRNQCAPNPVFFGFRVLSPHP